MPLSHRLALACAILGFAASVASLFASPIEGVTDLDCPLKSLDCAEALGGRFSKVAGLPLGVLGGAYFAAWSAALVFSRRPGGIGFRAVATWTLVFGAAVSVTLVGLLIFVVKSVCLYCLITHASNLAAFALLWPGRRWRPSAGFFRSERRSLWIWAATALLAGLLCFAVYQIRVARATVAAKAETLW